MHLSTLNSRLGDERLRAQARNRKLTESREVEVWDEYFREALEGRGQEFERNLWWDTSDHDTFALFKSLQKEGSRVRAIEVGCGSGKSALKALSAGVIDHLVLLDASKGALSFAKRSVPSGQACQVELCQGSAFYLPFRNGSFDLVWNVGVVEHYQRDEIECIAEEMSRVAKTGGVVVIGYPNPRSWATRKARFLGSRAGRALFSWIPGYRNETELPYSTGRMVDIVRSRAPSAKLVYCGSAGFVSTPDFLVRMMRRIPLLTKTRFLCLLWFRVGGQEEDHPSAR